MTEPKDEQPQDEPAERGRDRLPSEIDPAEGPAAFPGPDADREARQEDPAE
jgi:hypothetical protein